MRTPVLLVDDHAMFLEGLKLLLGKAEDLAVVGEAANAAEAVRLARELRPRVVVLDISLPGRTGLDALAQLRAAAPATRVVMLTMHADAEYAFQSLRAGASGYVLKESAGRELLEAIRAAARGEQHLSPGIAGLTLLDYARGRHAANSALEVLSPREREVLRLVVEGKSSKEIATLVQLSPKTVETYRSRLMGKLGLRSVSALVKFAIAHGVTSAA